MLVREGTPSEADPEAQGDTLTSTETAGPSTCPPSTEGCDDGWVTSSGYFRAWFTDPDPPDAEVNSVKSTVTWRYNNSRISEASCVTVYGWLNATGWGLQQHDEACQLFGSPATLSTNNAYAHFKNGIFCFARDTNVWYDRNYVYGNYIGTLSGTVTTRKNGGCASYLHLNYLLRRNFG
jgi:hypothetical protein